MHLFESEHMFNRLEVLSNGSSGKVYKVELNGDKNAMKVAIADSAIRELKQEIQLYAMLAPHSNVVRLMGAFTEPRLGMIIELYGNRSVEEYLKDGNELSLIQVRQPMSSVRVVCCLYHSPRPRL